MPLVAFSIVFLLLTLKGIRLKQGIIYYTKHTKYIFFSLLFVVVISSFLVKTEMFSTTFNRLEILFTEENGGSSANARLVRYSEAYKMFQDSPFFGKGIGSFPVSFSSIDARDYPHNIFLELLSELGLLGLILFLFLLTVSIGRLIKVSKRDSINKMYLGLLAGFLFSFLNALVSGDINDNRILFTFIAIGAMTPALSKIYKENVPQQE
jgi:O-antigen ligase